jgi:hypothetical protein
MGVEHDELCPTSVSDHKYNNRDCHSLLINSTSDLMFLLAFSKAVGSNPTKHGQQV